MGKIAIAIQIIDGKGKAPVKIKGGTQQDYLVLNGFLDVLKKNTVEQIEKLGGKIKYEN